MRRFMAGLLAIALLTGCASTYRARKATPSGFLGDYSQLKKGDKDQELLIYVSPRAGTNKYEKIMMDPVRIYVSETNSRLSKIPKEDLQRMVNYLDSTVRALLKESFTMVDQPGPGVMQLRIALTDAQTANRALDTVSTLLPIGLAVSELRNLATGSHTAVGSAGIEYEGLDSLTHKRLFAAVDRRVGRKVTGKLDKFDKWHTANDAIDYWASKIHQRLLEQALEGNLKLEN